MNKDIEEYTFRMRNAHIFFLSYNISFGYCSCISFSKCENKINKWDSLQLNCFISA